MEYNEKTAVDWLKNNGFTFLRTGSREICNPPVVNTDVDFAVLSIGSFNFEKEGWIATGEQEEYGADSSNFETFRSGEVNLIVVSDKTYYWQWRVATAAAKQLNIHNNDKRKALFQGVLYGNWE